MAAESTSESTMEIRVSSPERDHHPTPPPLSTIWKGENESDGEYTETQDPLEEAGVWTEHEAYRLYREKLVRLRELYMGQLGHLKHAMQERRRRFLSEWQSAGGTRAEASLPSQGGDKTSAAYRAYRRKKGEEGLLERKLKLRRLSATLDIYSKKEVRDANRPHYQHLVKLQQQLKNSHSTPCLNTSCANPSLPFGSRCSKHILDDPKQQLYTQCSYTYQPTSGSTVYCHNPVLRYQDPPLCGGHLDHAQLLTSEDKQEKQKQNPS